MENYEAFIRKNAFKYSGGNNENFEDLCQVGRMVCFETMQKTDHAGYISTAIKRSIRSSAQTWAGALTSGGSKTKSISGFVEQGYTDGKTVEEMAAEFEVSEQRISNILRARQGTSDYSELAETVGFDHDFDKNIVKELVNCAVDELDCELQHIIHMAFWEEMSLARIANELGIGKSTVHRKLNIALEILRRNPSLERLV